MIKFFIKMMGLAFILISVSLAFPDPGFAADNRQQGALFDSMQIQTIVTTTDSTSSKDAKSSKDTRVQQNEKNNHCNTRTRPKQKPVARKEISWFAWLTGSHRAPSLHFLDIVELFGL